MVTKGTHPEFIERLIAHAYNVRRLGEKTPSGYELYLVDLLGWRLRFSDLTPLIWVNAEAAKSLPAPKLAESLKDVVREHGWHRECIVLMDADGEELKAQTAGHYFPEFHAVFTHYTL